ncbi:MAG TPA: hypothetical protein VFJ19_12850 [Nocardioidaceae bacterium]|nr:hypothetical protein [Nocardioidaceae bacterium]
MSSSQPEDDRPEKDRAAPIETDHADSNPNAASSEGLEGDMGLSSERADDFEGIESTGTQKSSLGRAEGSSPTQVDVPDDPEAERLEPDEDVEEGGGAMPGSGVDRTVGESNPARVPSHRSDPAKNPGHSHG